MAKPRFLPKFPIFVETWFSSERVQAMTAAEEGAYIRLLLLQWREGSVPGDEGILLRLSRLEGTAVQHRLVFDAFPLGEDGRRRNAFCATQRLEAEAYCDAQAVKGRASGAARGNGKRTNRGSTRAEPDGNRRRTQSNPPTPTPTPTPTPSSDCLSSSLRSEGAPPPDPVYPPPKEKPKKLRKVASGPHHEAIRIWDELWLESRGEAFAWTSKETSGIKAALTAAKGDVEAFRARAHRLLFEPPDPWYGQNASPTILASRWNQLVVRVVRRSQTLDERNTTTLLNTMEELAREA